MKNHRRNMSCEQFSAQMAKLVAAGENLFAHPHVRQCSLHRALLEDLEEIAKAAKEMFPEVDPPDTLWDGIEARLAQKPLFASLISDPRPGFRVIVNARVNEGYNPHASPPVRPDGQKSAKRPNIVAASWISARRERRG